jgi:hypothetical protein
METVEQHHHDDRAADSDRRSNHRVVEQSGKGDPNGGRGGVAAEYGPGLGKRARRGGEDEYCAGSDRGNDERQAQRAGVEVANDHAGHDDSRKGADSTTSELDRAISRRDWFERAQPARQRTPGKHSSEPLDESAVELSRGRPRLTSLQPDRAPAPSAHWSW